MFDFVKNWLEDRKWDKLHKLTRWADQFQEDPEGLRRWDHSKTQDEQKFISIHEIVVDSEETKEQLLLAFRYLHDRDIDTDFMAVNYLVHLYDQPDKIVVKK